MSLCRRTVCRLFVVGTLLGAMAGGGAMAQPTPLSDRAAFIEQRLTTLKAEIGKIKDSLRDAKTIVEYFDIITNNMTEYRESFRAYETNCFERRREYEAMRRDNNPFAARLMPPVQRCEADRPGFDESIRKLSALAETISRDVSLIKAERGRLEVESGRTSNEQNIFQTEQNLRRTTREMGDQIQNFKNTRF
ncbi:hypothetical protein [Methylobacterium indicum]|uniref:t-SNARE coiled-coil homology domain-containing protein n=1 Tax=Methylobacterium indicum TaxID=1775910 RepID=A0ABR5HD33_9HYPH|nr:hypothetical protein [Methylobacterium indicum]KMO23379.1 hypothetical protein QR78_04640 [Methylobacterium indicum]KMO23860.1 hypothetical protein QR79_12720 [Methylobacterium indicum]